MPFRLRPHARLPQLWTGKHGRPDGFGEITISGKEKPIWLSLACTASPLKFPSRMLSRTHPPVSSGPKN
jgi:hypothetical protein